MKEKKHFDKLTEEEGIELLNRLGIKIIDMENDLKQTIGEHRVRTEFNPSNEDSVSIVKQKSATLINICESYKDKDPRLAALAMTAYEEAAMWAVKLLTAK